MVSPHYKAFQISDWRFAVVSYLYNAWYCIMISCQEFIFPLNTGDFKYVERIKSIIVAIWPFCQCRHFGQMLINQGSSFHHVQQFIAFWPIWQWCHFGQMMNAFFAGKPGTIAIGGFCYFRHYLQIPMTLSPYQCFPIIYHSEDLPLLAFLLNACKKDNWKIWKC